MGLVRRNLWGCSKKIKSSAYTTLIKPLLEYASCVWDSSNQSNNTKLNRVQCQATRFCKNNYIREEGLVTKLIEELNWQPLEVRRKVKKCIMFYKIHHPTRNPVRFGTRPTVTAIPSFLPQFPSGITCLHQLSMPQSPLKPSKTTSPKSTMICIS